MNNRTMATVYVDRDSISLKTRSRSGCSPQYFIILKKELQRLEEKKYLITKDIHSYAELRLCDAVASLQTGNTSNLKFSGHTPAAVSVVAHLHHLADAA